MSDRSKSSAVRGRAGPSQKPRDIVPMPLHEGLRNLAVGVGAGIVELAATLAESAWEHLRGGPDESEPLDATDVDPEQPDESLH